MFIGFFFHLRYLDLLFIMICSYYLISGLIALIALSVCLSLLSYMHYSHMCYNYVCIMGYMCLVSANRYFDLYMYDAVHVLYCTGCRHTVWLLTTVCRHISFCYIIFAYCCYLFADSL